MSVPVAMERPSFMRGGPFDKQLEDLLETSSWRQAVSLCEKRIKKGDRSDESLVCSYLCYASLELEQQSVRD